MHKRGAELSCSQQTVPQIKLQPSDPLRFPHKQRRRLIPLVSTGKVSRTPLARLSPLVHHLLQLLWHTYPEYVFSCSLGISQCRFSPALFPSPCLFLFLSGIRGSRASSERNYGVNAELSKPRRFTVRGRPPISTLRSSIEYYEFLRRVDLFAGKSSLDSPLICTARIIEFSTIAAMATTPRICEKQSCCFDSVHFADCSRVESIFLRWRTRKFESKLSRTAILDIVSA